MPSPAHPAPSAARPYVAVFAACLALSACASHMVQVPPRFDLADHGRLAVVTFSAEPSRASLAQLATSQFAESVLDSQSGIELLELGPADSVVARLLAAGDVSAAAQQVGRQKNVGAVFFGQLAVSGTKPSGSVGAGGSVNVSASVAADLSTRLLSTSTGGTLWRSSASSSRNVGQVTTSGVRLPSISASDPNAAYADMVEELVAQVTRDFRSTWVKQ